MVPRKRDRLFLGRFKGVCKGDRAPTRIQRSDSCGKRRNNGTDDACPPQAADRMRDVEFVPTQLPLCHPFFRPSTAFSFPCGKESGVENAFLPRQKRYGPRSGGDGAPNQTAPSAHSNAGLKPPLRKHKAAKAFLTNGAAPSRARLLLSYRSTFSKRPADVWKASVLSSSQTAAPPSRIGSCRSWSCRA